MQFHCLITHNLAPLPTSFYFLPRTLLQYKDCSFASFIWLKAVSNKNLEIFKSFREGRVWEYFMLTGTQDSKWFIWFGTTYFWIAKGFQTMICLQLLHERFCIKDFAASPALTKQDHQWDLHPHLLSFHNLIQRCVIAAKLGCTGKIWFPPPNITNIIAKSIWAIVRF